MATRVETIVFSHQDQKSRSINVRELIILSLGLMEESITQYELFTVCKNLAVRIKSYVEYKLPNQEIFDQIIQKMIKKRIIEKSYSLFRKKYTLTLSEMGLGEYDSILMSILNPRIALIFEEFKELIEYTQ